MHNLALPLLHSPRNIYKLLDGDALFTMQVCALYVYVYDRHSQCVRVCSHVSLDVSLYTRAKGSRERYLVSSSNVQRPIQTCDH